MKKTLLIILFAFCTDGFTQSLRSYATLISARPLKNPDAIFLHWEKDTTATSYSLFRKAPSDASWGNSIGNPAATDTSFTDNNIVAGREYEYKIVKQNGTSGQKTGYTLSGIDIPAKEDRGLMLLLIDSAIYDDLVAEIQQLEWDLIGDGWQLQTDVVSSFETAVAIKQLIKQVNQQYPGRLKSVFLLGHIAVPYSGQLNPDGHTDHIGAWPADTYYGDLDDNAWTDNTINDVSASRMANRNIPGDGKFDLSLIPGTLELSIGRVDLYDMPSFNPDQVALTRQYLKKNHEYRHKMFEVSMRAVIDNNFSPVAYPEVFAGSGLRSFSSLVGYDSIVLDDYFTTSKTAGGAILSYGCGGGSYTSAGGIGNSNDYKDSAINTVFSMTFGSYFGDWDNTNNFLKAPLAGPGKTLASMWAGRPHWTLHHLGSGYTLGYTALQSMNNISTYTPGYAAGGVHMGLMGDPSLRFHRVTPPSNLVKQVGTGSMGNPTLTLTWDAPEENVDGYYVYHSTKRNGPYTRITPNIITGTGFTHESLTNGENFYQVKSVKWNSLPSNYLNTSQAVFDSVNLFVSGLQSIKEPVISIFPVPTSGLLIIETENSIGLIELTDMSGKTIYLWNVNMEAGRQLLHLPEGLSNGLYLLRMQSGETRVSRKIVLLK